MNTDKAEASCVVTRKVKVKNDLGLHTRPATVIVRMLHKSKSSITFTHRGESINAKSILSILMLAARKNTTLKIEVQGEDAEETMENLVEAFENRFGEK